MMLAGWGNYPRGETRLVTARDPADLQRLSATEPAYIARGYGRAYGDAAIGSAATLSLARLDRMIAFDAETGLLTVESGVRLHDVIDALLPRGFFPPVVPGTKFVTIGGMVASNVHGKNHHGAGGFGRHVTRLVVLTADGRETACGPDVNEELFRATVGGMGLTGAIREVTFRMMPVESAFIRQETAIAANLDAVMAAFEESALWTYTVAWIDCLARGASLGRSVLYRGEHARVDDLRGKQAAAPYEMPRGRSLAVPFDLPNFTLNRVSVGAFNALYFQNAVRRQGPSVVSYHPYFFPLDAVAGWNRIYGKRGFVQHQCVIPKRRSRDALGHILDLVAREGSPSFLAVLKLLGPDEAGLMAFPMEGYTLALDFPANKTTFDLLAKIDKVLLECGGRIYFAKDARQSREMVEAGYPNLAKFREFRRASGAAMRFRSLQSERLGL